MLLPPKDFQAWRSKLDQLKQVVRIANPSELSIHRNQFTMLKKKEGITDDDIKTCTVELEKEENADDLVEDDDEESV